MWEKEKMLVTSIFSFSHNAFKAFLLKVVKRLCGKEFKFNCIVKISYNKLLACDVGTLYPQTQVLDPKGLVTPANGFVTEEKRIKHAEFGYPVTKFISSDARDSSNRFVKHLSQIMTVHQMGVSIRFIRWKVLNMFKT